MRNRFPTYCTEMREQLRKKNTISGCDDPFKSECSWSNKTELRFLSDGCYEGTRGLVVGRVCSNLNSVLTTWASLCAIKVWNKNLGLSLYPAQRAGRVQTKNGRHSGAKVNYF